jgi:hypothetical protein
MAEAGGSTPKTEEDLMLEKMLLPGKHAISILIKDHDKGCTVKLSRRINASTKGKTNA